MPVLDYSAPSLTKEPEVRLTTESMIPAQNERWRRGLGMQVERTAQAVSGERVSNAWVICPKAGDNVWKRTLIPNVDTFLHGRVSKGASRLGRSPRPIS